MTWIDRLNNRPFKITTGDGATFQPLWRSGEKSLDFNATKYDFINLEGSFIDRKQAQGGKYPLLFWFQGEDNIDQAEAFENSAKDPRAWTVEHPFYGTLRGQPINLKRDDSKYNVTQVEVEFWESISDDFPNSKISVVDETRGRVNALNLQSINVILSDATPETSDINLMRSNSFLIGSKFSPDSDNFNDYKIAVQTAVDSSSKLVTDTESSYSDAQEIIAAPAGFNLPVLERVKSYAEAYKVIKESIDGVFSKFNFESQGASILNGICLSCLTPLEEDYVTRSNIEEVNSILLDTYSDYLKTLDDQTVSIYDTSNYWTPNVSVQTALNQLVYFSSQELFSISFNARQERTIETTEDSNIIVLTHKLIGLDADDKNLELFKNINNLRGQENFKIKKGRTIKYFV